MKFHSRFLVAVLAVAVLPCCRVSAAGDPAKTQTFVAVLQSGAGLFDKARACQQLGETGSKDAVPALAALLADPQLAAYARSGLEGISDPSAAEALRAAAGSLKGTLLAGVVNSLGVLRDPNAAGLLAKIAADPASGAAREALLALGRVCTLESIQSLRKVLADGPEPLRAEAAAGLLLAAERQMSAGQPADAAALYDAVRAVKVPAALRAGAARGAVLARKTDGAFLGEQLRSEDRVIRNAALTAVRESPSDAWAGVLNAELAKASPELQALLLAAMAQCHNDQSPLAAQAKVSSDDPAVRKAALAVLGTIGGAAQADVLIQAMAANRAPDETALALDGLGRIQGAGVDARILAAITSTADAGARVKYIRLAESRGMTNAVSELLKQAGSTEPKTSAAAFAALKTLAGPGTLPAVAGLVNACKNDTSRQAAENAFAGVCLRAGRVNSGCDTALAALKEAGDPAVKTSWMRILVLLGDPKALPAIKAVMTGPDDALAAAAAEQLAGWADPAPVDDLLAVAESDAKPAQRQKALGAALQLAGAAAEEHQRPDDVLAGWFQRAARVVQSPEHKRQLVSGLGRVPRVESFRLLAGYLTDPSLQTEAAMAVVQIAPALTKSAEAAALKEALEWIATVVNNPGLRTRAAAIARTIQRPAKAAALFDGRSLAGWDGNTNVWRAQDGAIVGGSMDGNPRNEFLAFARPCSNFVLRLEYKLAGTEGFVNGGVQFRSVRTKEPPNEMSGFQADIGAGYSGALYDESRRNKFLKQPPADQVKRLEKPGQWNQYEVRCSGSRIQITLNGEQTVDYTETDPAIARTGLIALQIHGNCKAQIAFRNITLEE